VIGFRAQILYTIELTPAQIRRLVNLQFKKHKGLTDPRVIDMMVVQCEMELEETLNQWKMKPHVMELLNTKELLDPGITIPELVDETADQRWIMELVKAAEREVGSKHDPKRAERLMHLAADRVRGPSTPPGSEIAPTMPPGTQELWSHMATTGTSRILDKVVGGEHVMDARSVYSGDKPRSVPPASIQQLRDASDRGAMQDSALATLASAWWERKQREEIGDMAFLPCLSPRAEASLPQWVATRTFQSHPATHHLSEDAAVALSSLPDSFERPRTAAENHEAAERTAEESISEYLKHQRRLEQVDAMFDERAGFSPDQDQPRA
jgi:hypothetical protein